MAGLIPWRKKKPSLYDPFFLEPFFPVTGFFAENHRWLPSMDVHDEGNEITVTAEIPGMEKKDIDVSIKGRFLTIKGEKSTEYKKEKKRFFQKERSYGYFERSLKLPAEVDDASVKAKYKRGVLTIRMKKSSRNQNKLIELKNG